MNISVVTLFPELYGPFITTSLVHRAQELGHALVHVTPLFDYAQPKERVDAPTFGHGAGMLIKPAIVQKAIEAQEAKLGAAYKVFFSPHGKKLDQHLLRTMLTQIQEKGHLLLLPARYEGMDARVEEHYADAVLSIGDFVLMGGDIPAMVFIEALLRLIPGVIGKQASVEHESFSQAFVDYPEYTEPVMWQDKEVPAVVRSGNHKQLAQWRQEQAAQRTVLHHFDWLRSHITNEEDKRLARRFIPAHYVFLMHNQVLMADGNEGTSSVTSLDIHDIARSARTYNFTGYTLITPLEDQAKIVRKLLDFWNTDAGITYNPHRHEALSSVELAESFDQAYSAVAQKEGAAPVVIATGARKQGYSNYISYYDQETVWSLRRPVILVLGTARGLGPSLLERCDFILEPLEGFGDFNHLSVRTAAGIIFDRWLGINTVTYR